MSAFGKISLKRSTYEWLREIIRHREDSGHGTKCHYETRAREGKNFHTAPAFLKCLPDWGAASVLRGRANFNPRRW
jgi:hypothetical protein